MARITLRVPGSWVEGLDEIALDRSEPGNRIGTSEIAREAFAEYLDAHGIDVDEGASLSEPLPEDADEQTAD